MFERILLAVDDSERSMRAAKIVGDLARAMNTNAVRIVSALQDTGAYMAAPDFQPIISVHSRDNQRILEEAREAVGEFPGKVELESLGGLQAEALNSVARLSESTVIVIALRSPSMIAEMMLEGVSGGAPSLAPCPVLVVR